MILQALFLRPLRRAPLRFLATLLGIAAGVAGFVATLASNRAALSSLREDTRAIAGAASLEIVSPALVPQETLALLRPLCADAVLVPVIEDLVLEPHSGAVLRLCGIDPLVDREARALALPPLAGEAGRRFLAGEGVWIAEPLARTLGVAPGARLALEAHGRLQELEVLGTLALDGAPEAFATAVLADLALAETITGRRGRLDRIELVPRAGVDAGALEERVRRVLPPSLELRSTGARAAELSALVHSLEFNLQALSGISLLVAAVLVATALATSVVQRRATLALLVSLGASRAQLCSALLAEALALGIVGGTLGALGGWASTRFVPSMRDADDGGRVVAREPGALRGRSVLGRARDRRAGRAGERGAPAAGDRAHAAAAVIARRPRCSRRARASARSASRSCSRSPRSS